MVRFRGRVFRTNEERNEYLRDLDKRRNWVFLKLDRTRTAFTDLDEFAGALFPLSLKRQEAFVAIVKTFVVAKRPLYLRDLIQRLPKSSVKVSDSTLNAVWKAMLRAGLLGREHRGTPARLSMAAAARLEETANYWRNYLQSHSAGKAGRAS
jgi:hypothetical protein